MRIITAALMFSAAMFLTACVEHDYYSSQAPANAYASSGSVPAYTTGYNRDYQPPKKHKTAPVNYYSRQSFQRSNDYYSSQPPTSMGYSSSGSQGN